MKIRLLLAAIALAFSSATASAANFTQNITITGDAASFGQAHVGTAGAFTDTYFFTGITGAYNVNLALFSFGINAAQNIDFTSVFLNGNALDVSNVGFLSTAATPTDILTNSPFTLVVNGVAGRNASYSGNINVAAVVPEPKSYSLMLAGLCLVGFAVRRRKNMV
jgi:hypothetical protein